MQGCKPSHARGEGVFRGGSRSGWGRLYYKISMRVSTLSLCILNNISSEARAPASIKLVTNYYIDEFP